jgi:hypothetical protein
MIRRSWMTICVAAIWGSACAAHAQEDLAATTELGITITPDQMYDAIQETQDFWPPVRHYIASDQFPLGTEATRRQASDFFKGVNDGLHDRLFGEDEAAALDLFDYLAARLRYFELYRQLRAALDDDHRLVALKADWEGQLREIGDLDPQARNTRIHESVDQMVAQVRSQPVELAQVAAVGEAWHNIAAAYIRMNETAAGQMMIGFENDAKAYPEELGLVIRAVVQAQDWAQVVKPAGKLLRRADFEAAWTELERLGAVRTAAR